MIPIGNIDIPESCMLHGFCIFISKVNLCLDESPVLLQVVGGWTRSPVFIGLPGKIERVFYLKVFNGATEILLDRLGKQLE